MESALNVANQLSMVMHLNNAYTPQFFAKPATGVPVMEVVNNFKLNFDSRFYKNCKRQRKNNAKICQECPFRKWIEKQERKRNEIS